MRARGRGFCSDNVSARPDVHTLAESEDVESVDVHPLSSLRLQPRSISNALIAPLPQMMLISTMQHEPSAESRGLEKRRKMNFFSVGRNYACLVRLKMDISTDNAVRRTSLPLNGNRMSKK